MADMSDFLKSDLAKGLAIGVGVTVATPLLLAIASGRGGSFGRAVIRTGMIMFEKGRETVAEVSEVVEDLVAETKAEMQVTATGEESTKETMQDAEEVNKVTGK